MLPNHTSTLPSQLVVKAEKKADRTTEEGLKTTILENHLEVGARDNALTTQYLSAEQLQNETRITELQDENRHLLEITTKLRFLDGSKIDLADQLQTKATNNSTGSLSMMIDKRKKLQKAYDELIMKHPYIAKIENLTDENQKMKVAFEDLKLDVPGMETIRQLETKVEEVKTKFREASNIRDNYKVIQSQLKLDSIQFENRRVAAEQMRNQAADECSNVDIVYQKALEAAIIMQSNLEYLEDQVNEDREQRAQLLEERKQILQREKAKTDELARLAYQVEQNQQIHDIMPLMMEPRFSISKYYKESVSETIKIDSPVEFYNRILQMKADENEIKVAVASGRPMPSSSSELSKRLDFLNARIANIRNATKFIILDADAALPKFTQQADLLKDDTIKIQQQKHQTGRALTELTDRVSDQKTSLSSVIDKLAAIRMPTDRIWAEFNRRHNVNDPAWRPPLPSAQENGIGGAGATRGANPFVSFLERFQGFVFVSDYINGSEVFHADLARVRMLCYLTVGKSIVLNHLTSDAKFKADTEDYELLFGASIGAQIQLPVPPALPNPEDVMVAAGQFQVCDFGLRDGDLQMVGNVVYDPESKPNISAAQNKLVGRAAEELKRSRINPEELTNDQVEIVRRAREASELSMYKRVEEPVKELLPFGKRPVSQDAAEGVRQKLPQNASSDGLLYDTNQSFANRTANTMALLNLQKDLNRIMESQETPKEVKAAPELNTEDPRYKLQQEKLRQLEEADVINNKFLYKYPIELMELDGDQFDVDDTTIDQRKLKDLEVKNQKIHMPGQLSRPQSGYRQPLLKSAKEVQPVIDLVNPPQVLFDPMDRRALKQKSLAFAKVAREEAALAELMK